MAILFLSAGCVKHIPDTVLAPPPAPTPAPPAEPAVLAVNVTIDAEKARVTAENSIPSEDIKWDAWGDKDGWTYRYLWKRHQAMLSIGDNPGKGNVRLNVAGEYAVAVGKRVFNSVVKLASCGESQPLPRFSITANANVGIAKDWEVTSVTEATLEPGICKVTIFNLPGHLFLKSKLQPKLDKAAADIDKKLKSLPLRSHAENIWKKLNEPLRLDKEIWLDIRPRRTIIEPLSYGEKSLIKTSVALVAQPLIVFGPKPSASASPLPPLETGKPGEGFHVPVTAAILFNEATKLLNAHVAGSEFKVGGYKFKVGSAEVSGYGDRVLVKIVLSGDIEGGVYLIGQPVYDGEHEQIILRELDYEAQTLDFLATIADWLLHDSFKEKIAKNAKWSVKTTLDQLRQKAANALNNTDIGLSGQLDSLRGVAVYMTATGMEATAVAEGNLHFHIQPE